jgi:hypothetical protein
MSSTIWTPAALSAEARVLAATCWRVVEAQHRISTMKLADSIAEQALLERLIDDTKAQVPDGCRHLHYLLATPFRYAVRNPYPSRFRAGGSAEGVFYASASPETAIAEIGFHRLLFFAESSATPLPTNPADYTAFAVQVSAAKAIDLARPPLNRDAALWGALSDYAPCQRLAEAARAGGIEAIVYPSVRDTGARANYALLAPAAFAQDRPLAFQSWHVHLRRDVVLAKCEAPSVGLSLKVADWARDPRLKAWAA